MLPSSLEDVQTGKAFRNYSKISQKTSTVNDSTVNTPYVSQNVEIDIQINTADMDFDIDLFSKTAIGMDMFFLIYFQIYVLSLWEI